MSGPELDAAVAARECPGNRASTMLLMPELSALPARTTARDVRAPDLRRGDALRHQSVRRVRRRIRQDARRPDRRQRSRRMPSCRPIGTHRRARSSPTCGTATAEPSVAARGVSDGRGLSAKRALAPRDRLAAFASRHWNPRNPARPSGTFVASTGGISAPHILDASKSVPRAWSAAVRHHRHPRPARRWSQAVARGAAAFWTSWTRHPPLGGAGACSRLRMRMRNHSRAPRRVVPSPGDERLVTNHRGALGEVSASGTATNASEASRGNAGTVWPESRCVKHPLADRTSACLAALVVAPQ
jgi:hypothetical protein